MINNNKIKRNASSDSYSKILYNNSILDENESNRQIILNMKRYDYNTKEKEKNQNYSIVNYLIDFVYLNIIYKKLYELNI